MILLSVLDVPLIIINGTDMIYQGLCIVMSLFAKSMRFPDAPMTNRHAVPISAHNEEKVIGNLTGSIHGRTYPPNLINIWLVIDNYTDNTADVVRSLGCRVVGRRNLELVGEGYALTYLLEHMLDISVANDYETYFVFDTDNKPDKHYFEEMNKAFYSGSKILTSYCNSVNLADNWMSSGSTLWFIHESRFLFNSRTILDPSCHVGGMGLMFSRGMTKRNKGWKFHPLAKDLEFTMDPTLHSDRIGYCGATILYDGQPVTFSRSRRQHLCWSKGLLQVFRYYGSALLKRTAHERSFSYIDFTLMLCPFAAPGAIRTVVGLLFITCGFVSQPSQLRSLTGWSSNIIISVLGLMTLAALTIIVERNQIGATNKELFAYVLSFSICVLNYVPTSFQAIFTRAQWKPIAHES